MVLQLSPRWPPLLVALFCNTVLQTPDSSGHRGYVAAPAFAFLAAGFDFRPTAGCRARCQLISFPRLRTTREVYHQALRRKCRSSGIPWTIGCWIGLGAECLIGQAGHFPQFPR